MDASLALPLPPASVTSACSEMLLSMQTHVHVQTHTLFVFFLSHTHTHTHLSTDTGGLTPGPVRYWFSERTCSSRGGQATSSAACLLVLFCFFYHPWLILIVRGDEQHRAETHVSCQILKTELPSALRGNRFSRARIDMHIHTPLPESPSRSCVRSVQVFL